ncbi:MAG: DUF4271 domain-containing protein [Bacteroidales bacterium]|nr:DUF4271 domain-containing protein [Lentimicrobiaceae bacterium]MDD5694618.1 DUF4271 domain-containing protein [Bacteroidales bacterium]
MNQDSLLIPFLPDSVPVQPVTHPMDEVHIAKDFPDLIRYHTAVLTAQGIQPASKATTSYFQTQPFAKKEFTPEVRLEVLNDWIFPVLLICFAIFAWIRTSYRKRFTQLVQASYSKQYMNLLMREGGGGYDLINLSLGFIFICATALLIFQFSESLSGPSASGSLRFLLFLAIAGGIVLWLLFRLFLIRMLGWTFRNFEVTSQYLMSSMAYNFLTGIILLPFLVINAYSRSSFFLYISLGIIGIFFLLRLFRGIVIGLSDTKFSIFYLFFYLCTVEILPILTIVKLAKDNL